MYKKFNLKEHFEKIVQKNGKKIAIKFNEIESYDFAFLDQQSNILQKIFKKLNIKKGDVIGIDSQKHINSFVIILACIKYGNPYSFIEITKQNYRLKKILEILKPKIIFTFKKKNINENICVIKKNFSYKCYYKNKRTFQLSLRSKKKQDVVYIMFTSGSTGDPKGVPITSNNLSFFIKWVKSTFNINTDTVASNLNPLHFDNSIFDIFGCLFNGATLVPFDKNELLTPAILLNKFKQTHCDTWFSVPSLMNYIIELNSKELFKDLKIKNLIFGGERFPINAVKKIYKYLKKTNIYNVSGPTECTCICSSKLILKKDLFNSNNLSVGRINNYFKYYIKKKIQDRSSFNKGELVLEGPAVAYGYYNERELTKKKFYKKKRYYGYFTGDIVKKLKNKELKILGRVDNQIKLMGHRIELEEIENQIIKIFNIKECVVKIIDQSKSLKEKLICVVNRKDKSKFINFLPKINNKLPGYAIPKKIVFIKNFNYNSNGKIDRNLIEINNDKNKYI